MSSGKMSAERDRETCPLCLRDWHPDRYCSEVPAPIEDDVDEVVRGDLLRILTALGLGTHARPYSAHAVVEREVLPLLEKLREFATDMINAPDDSAADWGYDLAHLLGMLDVDNAR